MPNIDENLAFVPSHELAALIAGKQVSPVEVTQLYYDRIERLDSQLNSYLTLTKDEAMESARAAEEAVMRGDALGSLHGVPISIKDLQMMKGVRATLGSLAYKDNVPAADSAVVERVKETGAIILGKTNTPEFGLLGANENRLGDDCRNPWNTERTSGASSGGAGRGGCSRALLARHGGRRRRLDTHTCQLLRHLRHQAHPGARLQFQRCSTGSAAGEYNQPAGSDVAHGQRLGDTASGAGGLRTRAIRHRCAHLCPTSLARWMRISVGCVSRGVRITAMRALTRKSSR